MIIEFITNLRMSSLKKREIELLNRLVKRNFLLSCIQASCNTSFFNVLNANTLILLKTVCVYICQFLR